MSLTRRAVVGAQQIARQLEFNTYDINRLATIDFWAVQRREDDDARVAFYLRVLRALVERISENR